MLLIDKCIVLITNLRWWLVCVAFSNAHYKLLKLTALQRLSLYAPALTENTGPRVDCMSNQNSVWVLRKFTSLQPHSVSSLVASHHRGIVILREILEMHHADFIHYANCICTNKNSYFPLCWCISRSSPSFAFLTLLSCPWLAINSS